MQVTITNIVKNFFSILCGFNAYWPAENLGVFCFQDSLSTFSVFEVSPIELSIPVELGS